MNRFTRCAASALAAVLLLLMCGCTFFRPGERGVQPRTGEEMAQVSWFLYGLLVVFVLVAVCAVRAALTIQDERRYDDATYHSNSERRWLAVLIALAASAVVLTIAG